MFKRMKQHNEQDSESHKLSTSSSEPLTKYSLSIYKRANSIDHATNWVKHYAETIKQCVKEIKSDTFSSCRNKSS